MAFLFMTIFRYKSIRWLAVASYTALVYYLCLLPSSSIKSNDFLDKIYFDKWVHVMMYFGMWSLLVWGLKSRPGLLSEKRQTYFFAATILCLLMGATIEFLQLQIGRGMDWTDEIANLGGALLAWIAWIKLENKWKIYQW
jgi:VanZ family protein